MVDGRSFIAALIPEPKTDDEQCARFKDLQSLYDAFNEEIRVLHLRPPPPPDTIMNHGSHNYTEIPTWLQNFQKDVRKKQQKS
jgi:hypothetical protein